MENYYSLFGISNNATVDEIHTAYKNLIKKYHPDNNPGNAIAANKFNLVTVGGKILLNAEKRKEYDIQLRQYVLQNWQKEPKSYNSDQNTNQQQQYKTNAQQQPYKQQTNQQQQAYQQQQTYQQQQQAYQQQQRVYQQQAYQQQAYQQQAYKQQTNQQQQTYQQQQVYRQQKKSPQTKNKKIVFVALLSIVVLIGLGIIGYFAFGRPSGSKDYTVTFNIGYTTNTYPDGKYATRKVDKYSMITDRPDNPTRAGHVFVNWYKDTGLTAKWDFSKDKVTKNITLYASWSPLVPGVTEFTITYNLQGGTCDFANKTVLYHENYSLHVPTRTGYSFSGWFKEANGGSKRYTDNTGTSLETYTDTANITLLAVWTANTYKITYNYEGATGNKNTVDEVVTYGENYTLVVPTRDGYGFDGWYDSAVGGKQYSLANGQSSSVWDYGADIKLYAHWISIFTTNYSTITGLTEYGRTLSTITIPTKINEITYTDIGYQSDNAFSKSVILKTVTISSGFTRITTSAFSQCAEVETITIPSTVTSIGSNAFDGCKKLKNIALPNITAINSEVFKNCEALTYLSIPDSVTTIGWSAFRYSGLNGALSLKSNVVSIDTNAFADTKITSADLSQLTLLNNATLAAYMFNNCTLLTTVTLPSNLAIISSSVFCKSGLTQINFPASIREINNYAFEDTKLISADLSATRIVALGMYSFSGCSVLQTVKLPQTCIEIKSNAFATTTALTEIDLKSVEIIAASAFYKSGLTHLELPDTVKSIGEYAFAYTKIQTLSLSKNSEFTVIPGHAFSNCSVLNSVIIPSNITTIKGFAFSYCTAITSIFIPQTVTEINNNAFLSWGISQTINVERHLSRPTGWEESWASYSVTIKWGVVQ